MPALEFVAHETAWLGPDGIRYLTGSAPNGSKLLVKGEREIPVDFSRTWFLETGAPTIEFDNAAATGDHCINKVNMSLYVNVGTLEANSWILIGTFDGNAPV